MKQSFKKVLMIFLVFVLLLGTFSSATVIPVKADTKSDALAQLEENKKKEAELNAQINEAKKNKKDQQAYKNLLDAKISNYQNRIDICNDLIAKYKSEIAEGEKKIEESNEIIAETKEQFKRRLRALNNSNTNNSIQVLLGAESFSDFLIRLELTKCISKQDSSLIDSLIETIAGINSEIDANEKRQQEQAELIKSLKADKSEQDKIVDEVNGVINAINKDINNAESQIKALEEQNKYLNSLLYEGDVDAVFDGKFAWPVPGHYYISSPWKCSCSLHRGNHNGLDIAGGNIRGKPIVAAASGWVTKFVNSCRHDYRKYSSCGCGSGFGNHVRLSHGQYNGSSYLTIYGHMKSVVSGMHDNKYYNRGQVIGYVGTTGFSAGDHLHFAVVVNNAYRNPSNYL